MRRHLSTRQKNHAKWTSERFNFQYSKDMLRHFRSAKVGKQKSDWHRINTAHTFRGLICRSSNATRLCAFCIISLLFLALSRLRTEECVARKNGNCKKDLDSERCHIENEDTKHGKWKFRICWLNCDAISRIMRDNTPNILSKTLKETKKNREEFFFRPRPHCTACIHKIWMRQSLVCSRMYEGESDM